MKRITILLFAIATFINAETVSSKGTNLACPSESLYKDFVSAYAANGRGAVAVYVPKGCTIIFQGTSLSVLELNWSTTKVMFYDENRQSTAVMYTAIEAVR
jgi:hypothetical protein